MMREVWQVYINFTINSCIWNTIYAYPRNLHKAKSVIQRKQMSRTPRNEKFNVIHWKEISVLRLSKFINLFSINKNIWVDMSI